MIIDFEKSVWFHAEVDDEQFKDESGNINEDLIIAYCESMDSADDETCWVYSDKLKNIKWKKSEEESDKMITESEYRQYREEKERAEHCYECSGYGDDYDDKGNSNCEDCPFNSDNDEWHPKVYANPNHINPTEFISKFCNKVVEFYEGYVDRESVVNRVKFLFTNTKFSYLEINMNKRIFLFAENPMAFIKDINLWDYIQNWVNEEYKTFIAIGKYNMIEFGEDSTVLPLFDILHYIK